MIGLYTSNFYSSCTFLMKMKLTIYFWFHSIDEVQLPRDKNSLPTSHEECSWGNYARGALYALQKRKNNLKQVKTIFYVSLME